MSRSPVTCISGVPYFRVSSLSGVAKDMPA